MSALRASATPSARASLFSASSLDTAAASRKLLRYSPIAGIACLTIIEPSAAIPSVSAAGLEASKLTSGTIATLIISPIL